MSQVSQHLIGTNCANFIFLFHSSEFFYIERKLKAEDMIEQKGGMFNFPVN